MKHNNVYRLINQVKNPTLRSLLYSIVEDNWEDFYNKPITGFGKQVAGLKGFELVQLQLDNAQALKKMFHDHKIDWDIVQFMIYVYPAFIGKSLSKKPVDGWDYLKVSKIYRDPEYKAYIYEWRDFIQTRMKDYPLDKHRHQLIMDLLYDRDRSSLEYLMWFQIYKMLSSGLMLHKKR
jgi:hypothetical protein